MNWKILIAAPLWLAALACQAAGQSCNPPSGWLVQYGEIPVGNTFVLGPNCGQVQDGGASGGSAVQVVSVLSYAVCNGIANDTAGLIAAAVAARNKILYFPPYNNSGTPTVCLTDPWVLSQTLNNIPQQVWMYGAKLKARAVSVSPTLTVENAQCCIDQFDIQGLEIDASSLHAYALKIHGSQRMSLRNTNLHNATLDGLWMSGEPGFGNYDFVFSNLSSHDNGRDGAQLTSINNTGQYFIAADNIRGLRLVSNGRYGATIDYVSGGVVEFHAEGNVSGGLSTDHTIGFSIFESHLEANGGVSIVSTGNTKGFRLLGGRVIESVTASLLSEVSNQFLATDASAAVIAYISGVNFSSTGISQVNTGTGIGIGGASAIADSINGGVNGISLLVSGTTKGKIVNGLILGTPTGGDKGTGTLNAATNIYVNNVAVLTGNQTITLSGDVTGSGATAIATTIANGVVTNIKLANSTITLNTGANVGLTTPGAMSLGSTYTIGATTDDIRVNSLGLGVAAPANGRISQTLGVNNVTGHLIKRFTDTAPTGNFFDYQNAAGTSLLSADILGQITTKLIISGSASSPPTAVATNYVTVVGGTGNVAAYVVDAIASQAQNVMRRGNNTNASPSALLSGQSIGSFGWGGYDGSAWTTTNHAAQILAISFNGWSGTDHSAYLDLCTTPGASTTLTCQLRVNASGGVGIGTTTDPGVGQSLVAKAMGTVALTVATLPTCNAANKGMRAFVSDSNAATFHTAVAGGGANNVGVTCDGTNWYIS